MYSFISNIWCIIRLVSKLLTLVLKLKGQETMWVTSAGAISGSSNQIRY